MADAVEVAALCGSLRDASKTRVATETALAAADDAGADAVLIDRRDYDLPHYDPDADGTGDGPRLRETLGGADAVILASPNYHGSCSGALKNALDYCGRDEFQGCTVGLLEVAGGRFPRPALTHLRAVCRTLGAWTLPIEVGIPRSHTTVARGKIEDPEIRERVRELGRSAVRYAGVAEYPDAACDERAAPAGD